MANYEHYKVFCKIAECRSISKAAEQLFVSQPAISLIIKQLESDLGAKLFFRTQRGVVPTVEGELLYNYVKQGCSIIKVGEEKLKDLSKLQSGEVRIGASDMTLKFFLLPFIEKFHNDYPQVKIKVTNAPTPTTLKHLKEGEIDFGVISSPTPMQIEQNNIYDFSPVKSITDIVIAPKNFEVLGKKRIAVKELENYPFIMLEKGTSTRTYIESYLKENNVAIIPEIELATTDLIIEFVKRGIGFAFVMEDFVREELASGVIVKIDIEPNFLPRQFYIVKLKNTTLGAASSRLIQYAQSKE